MSTHILSDLAELFNVFLETYGVFGVFIVSFLGNAIPYSTVPYLFFIIVYSALIQNTIIKIGIVISGGIGAALGKLVVYYIGRATRKVLSEKTKKNIELFTKIADKGIFITVFLFAALPLPDDVIYVPLGITGYNVIKYFIALVTGKIVITGLAVFFGESLKYLFIDSEGMPWHIYIPVLIALTILLTIIIMKIDWVKVTEIGSEKGVVPAIIYLLKEVVKALLSIAKIFMHKK